MSNSAKRELLGKSAKEFFSMSQQPFTICDTSVHPGERAHLALPLPEQYSCAPLYMPIKVIHGHRKGPTLVIFSGLQGHELNGLEIANRIIETVSAQEIAGTIVAIPVMNVFGLTHYPQRMPTGQDLYQCFPGKEKGGYGERLAYLITEEILKKASYCIELQTGGLNHNILPQVYCNFEDREAKKLAKVFHSPVVTNVSLDGNYLRQTTEELQIPLIVYQAGEAMRFDQSAIALGVKGIHNVMRAIDLLAKEPVEEIQPIFSKDEEWLVAHKSGILHTEINLGQTIEKGDLIGNIQDPFGAELREEVRSPQKGIVVGLNTSPLIHEGLPIFKVASFLDYQRAENLLEEWDKKQQEEQNEREG